MKLYLSFAISLALLSCDSTGGDSSDHAAGQIRDTVIIYDTVRIQEEAERNTESPAASGSDKISHGPSANEVFRNVYVVRTGDGRYQVTGQARVFEASFSWVVEDGHNQLKEGHEMTDNGAPAWGNFDFEVSLDKPADPNTVPHLILLVYSARDGSPEHELPIPLP